MMQLSFNHSRVTLTLLSTLCMGSLLCVSAFAAGTTKTSGRKPHPFSDIKPILDAKCIKCHNETRHAEGVNLSTYEALLKGGEHGSIVTPGHPEKSDLFLYVDGTKKPVMPLRSAPLEKKEIDAIKDWIKSGAKP
jgi:hypothetical protein